MRWIFIIGTLVAVLWSFAWFSAKHLISTELTSVTQPDGVVLIDDWRGGALTHSISGFPFSFKVAANQPRVASSEQMFSWSAQQLDITSTLLGLNTVKANIFGPQQLMLGTQEVTYTGTVLNAVAGFDLAASLALEDVLISSEQGQLSSSWGWNAEVEDASVSLKRDSGNIDSFELVIGLESLRSDDISGGWPAADSPLPLDLQDFVFRASITPSYPLDRLVGMQDRAPEIERLELTYLGLKSGDLNIEIDSSLSWERDGLPSGTVNLTVDQWQIMFDFIRRLGIINEQDEVFFQSTLNNLAQASGDADRIELPLVIDEGVVRFGFIVVGRLPSLP